ncbi:uncharacterized protein LAESUDRAFT_812030, partial [Laetiporus sulphureus 93-53]
MPAVVKQPGSTVVRPPLPLNHCNPNILRVDPAKPPTVKFQEIVRDENTTIVGRLKIPTPSGHAFVLRRLDTGAISQTTMYRAAFPDASDPEEKGEAHWVKNTFDISTANKEGKARFAGVWVNKEDALKLAEDYGLSAFVSVLAEAEPDPHVVYRRSSRAQQSTPSSTPVTTRSRHETGPTPSKRRRAVSPSVFNVTPVCSPGATFSTVTAAALLSEPVMMTPTPPPSGKREASPGPRRTPRNTCTSLPTVTPLKPQNITPAPSVIMKEEVVTATSFEITTPPGSDGTAVEDEPMDEQRLADETMHEDIQEQKELIERLKADRAAREAEQRVKEEENPEHEQVHAESDEEMEMATPEPTTPAIKRPREEYDEMKLDIPEKLAEVKLEEASDERPIATNNRVQRAERKSLAWGALAFAAGVGAIQLIPTLQNYLPL